jgi:hypothetical protein
MTSISIIGLGTYARAVGTRAVEGGNAVEVIGRDAAEAKDLAALVGDNAAARIALKTCRSTRWADLEIDVNDAAPTRRSASPISSKRSPSGWSENPDDPGNNTWWAASPQRIAALRETSAAQRGRRRTGERS